MTTETIKSAIHCRLNEGQTIVHTSKGQWLRVSNYNAAYNNRHNNGNSPLLSECNVICITTEVEFDQNCTS